MACGFFSGGVNIECYDDAMWFGDPAITDPYQRYNGDAANNGTLMSDYGDDQAFWDYYWDVVDGTGSGGYMPDSGVPTFSTTGYGVTDPELPDLSGYDPFTGYSDAVWNVLYGNAPSLPGYVDPATQQCNCDAAVAAAKASCPSVRPSGGDSGTKPNTGGSGGGAILPAANGNCPQGYQKYGNLCIAPQQQAAKKDNTMLWLIIAVIVIWVYQES